LDLQEGMLGLLWDDAAPLDIRPEEALSSPGNQGNFVPVPEKLMGRLKEAGRDYKDFLARSFNWTLLRSPMLKMTSRPGETERDFRLRLEQKARELRDEHLAKLREKYAAKISSLERQAMAAQHRVEREQEQFRGQATQTAISMGAAILGAVFGRRGGAVGRATTTARSASRAYYEKQDIQRAKEKALSARERIAEMERSLEREADELARRFDPTAEKLQEIMIRPKKADIDVRWWGLLWVPF